ncbi:MAG: M23 family metallopeptidase [Alphaproteobacteria bacterium]|nr:M23 family metallopeptidase [Alphaproteobacteria bacterium]
MAVLVGTTLCLTAPEAAAATKTGTAKPAPAKAAAAKPTAAKARAAKSSPPRKPALAAAAARKPAAPLSRKSAKVAAVRGGKPVARALAVRGRSAVAAARAPALYRTASAVTATAPDRRVVTLIEEEESLIDVLVREDVATDDLIAAVDAFEDFEERAPLGRGDRIELVLGERNDAGELKLAAVRIARGQGGDVTLVRAADGTFTVAGGDPGGAALMVTMTGTVGGDWRGALAAADVPADVADEVDRLLALDLDLPRPVPRGASFEILAERRTGAASGPSHAVRYVGVAVAGVDHRIYRYMPPDGPAGYFDEAGRSIAPLALALPIADGKLTSDFGWRRHPKLRKRMFHRGIDLAAPIGTPIIASADGVVEFAGWRGAYGRYVRVAHGNGVSTGYGHLREYASAVVAGASVRQGEVIGYVGSSGRSTGPHVDFSVLVDGRPVNPLQALMPTPRDLAGPELVAFREHVAQIRGQAQATP